MSEDRPPYRRDELPGKLSDEDRIKRALETHKNWIWGDGIEIAKLRTKMKHLEADVDELKGYLERLLKKNDN